jgi:hypothetical protein
LGSSIAGATFVLHDWPQAPLVGDAKITLSPDFLVVPADQQLEQDVDPLAAKGTSPHADGPEPPKSFWWGNAKVEMEPSELEAVVARLARRT